MHLTAMLCKWLAVQMTVQMTGPVSTETELFRTFRCQMHMCMHAQRYLTLCDPRDRSLPGSSVHGIFQARVLEWVAIAFSTIYIQFSSVQVSRSVVSDSLWPHESQHARPPCPSPSPGVHSNSCPSSQWCHPAISSSVVPFSSCPQSLPASKSFPMSQLFTWGGQNTGVSALALGTDKNCLILLIQDTYNSQIHRARKYIDRCQGLGVGVGKENGELLFNGTEFQFRNMKYLRDGWW